jgi:phenylacetate-CoA ligase
MNSSSIVRNVIAPIWAWHEGSPYLSVLRTLQYSENLSMPERQAGQWQKLVNLLDHAWKRCPYYRKSLSSVGFRPGDLKGWSDFHMLPVLTKNDISQNVDQLMSSGLRKKNLVPRKTSGSTGVSLNFYVSDEEMQFKRGVQIYRDQWTGWRMGEWKALVWGNPSYKKSLRGRIRNSLLDRCFSLDTLRMDEAMMASFASEIFRRKPTLLFGHAHSLYLFACYWRDHKLPVFPFKGILSTAMVLHAHERELCQAVFQSPVFDRYGCEEVSLIASECSAHEGLHINTDSLIVEILKDDHPARAGETGRVIVTDLCNRAMPFIRYEVGDTAMPSDRMCSCGRSYPLLQCITGRVADYLRTPDGEWISGISLTENFATLIPGIHQIQIIQEESDFLRFRIVRRMNFDSASSKLISELVRQRFGRRMRFDIDFVDFLQPEASGKYRFSIYNVKTPHAS